VTTRSKDEKTRLVTIMSRFIPHTFSLGISVENVDGEALTLRLPYREELVGDPQTGALHGGVITVLLDQALGVSALVCDSLHPAIAPTLDLRIDHLGVAPAGKDILATASVYRTTRKVLFIQGIAYWDSPDKPIARATGTWVRLDDVDLSWMDQIDMEDL
jgi:uncharacterized protein (TIGR00369 family)